MLPPCPLSKTKRRNPWTMKFSRKAASRSRYTRGGRERTRKVEVVVRVSQPLERQQDPILVADGRPSDDLAQQHAIGEQRHVTAVLLERGDRKHDGRVP